MRSCRGVLGRNVLGRWPRIWRSRSDTVGLLITALLLSLVQINLIFFSIYADDIVDLHRLSCPVALDWFSSTMTKRFAIERKSVDRSMSSVVQLSVHDVSVKEIAIMVGERMKPYFIRIAQKHFKIRMKRQKICCSINQHREKCVCVLLADEWSMRTSSHSSSTCQFDDLPSSSSWKVVRATR